MFNTIHQELDVLSCRLKKIFPMLHLTMYSNACLTVLRPQMEQASEEDRGQRKPNAWRAEEEP